MENNLIFDQYLENKSMIKELYKKIFLLFETNDRYGIIKSSDIKFLDLEPDKASDSKIIVNLYAYGEINSRINFSCNRKNIISCDENTIQEWLEASRLIIERAYISKLRKFYKDFTQSDHVLIHAGIVNYVKLSKTMTDEEIAKKIARYVIESEFKEEHKENGKD